MPIRYSFTPRELVDPRNRRVMLGVAEMFEGSPFREGVLLEDAGSWLQQDAWVDRTGFYMTVRLAPLDVGRPEVRAEGRRLVAGFVDAFLGRDGVSYEGEELYEEGGRLTVFVETAHHSIGD
jgi:hypothetical protein